MMVSVNNGQANVQIDTTSMNEGRYKIHAEYTDGNYYNNASINNNILTLQNWQLIGKGQATPWSSNMWSSIEINSSAEAHSNYQHRNAILQAYELTGNFTIKLHIQVACAINQWYFGLTSNKTNTTSMPLKVESGDTLNGQSIATVFEHTSDAWDWTELVTISRNGTTYTLEYKGNTYTTTGTNNPVWFCMDKTGSCNIYLTHIELKNG